MTIALYRRAVPLQGVRAIAEGVTDPRDVAVDKSLSAAQGPVWHTTDQRAGRVPAGVDREAAWGVSEHDGWVYGYSYEVVVTATPNGTVFPLLASVDVASASEVATVLEKIDALPVETIPSRRTALTTPTTSASEWSITIKNAGPADASCVRRILGIINVPRRSRALRTPVVP
jgi:hypothetical protein